jgi:hypothetical protein
MLIKALDARTIAPSRRSNVATPAETILNLGTIPWQVSAREVEEFGDFNGSFRRS